MASTGAPNSASRQKGKKSDYSMISVNLWHAQLYWGGWNSVIWECNHPHQTKEDADRCGRQEWATREASIAAAKASPGRRRLVPIPYANASPSSMPTSLDVTGTTGGKASTETRS
jgi:hypothetical protein